MEIEKKVEAARAWGEEEVGNCLTSVEAGWVLESATQQNTDGWQYGSERLQPLLEWLLCWDELVQFFFKPNVI